MVAQFIPGLWVDPDFVVSPDGRSLTAQTVGGPTWRTAAPQSFPYGPVYYEVTLGGTGVDSSTQIGFGPKIGEPPRVAVSLSGIVNYNNSTVVGSGVSFDVGDTLMLACDTKNFWFGKNGAWYNDGNPALGTNPAYVLPTAFTLTPALAQFRSSVLLPSYVFHFATADTNFPVPAGFLAVDDFSTGHEESQIIFPPLVVQAYYRVALITLGQIDARVLRSKNLYFGGNGRIVGTVKNKGTPDVPVHRRVRLYLDRDGLPVDETWSDSVTGAYAFEHLDEAHKYTVLAYDHTGEFNGVVATGVVPVGSAA